MTYQELKDELYIVRENEKVIRSKIQDLYSLRDRYLTGQGGAVDYTKDRVQASKDPDKAMIFILDTIERRESELRKSIEELEDHNRQMRTLIYQMQGVKGDFLRLFFLEGHNCKFIGKRLHYDEDYCREIRRNAIADLLEVINGNV